MKDLLRYRKKVSSGIHCGRHGTTKTMCSNDKKEEIEEKIVVDVVIKGVDGRHQQVYEIMNRLKEHANVRDCIGRTLMKIHCKNQMNFACFRYRIHQNDDRHHDTGDSGKQDVDVE